MDFVTNRTLDEWRPRRDPRGGSQLECYGATRNLLIDGGPVDPLSQTAALSSSYVAVERV